MMKTTLLIVVLALTAAAQNPSAANREFIKTDAAVVALTHVRVIDGTGAAAAEDQTIVISGGKIQAVGANVAVPPNAQTLDLHGRTVMPGLVGMHDHMFFPM